MIRYYESNEGVYPITFKIYYGDGTIYTSTGNLKTAWDNAPSDNIQIVVVYENTTYMSGLYHTRVMLCGNDYYCYDGVRLGATDDEPFGAVKNGLWILDSDFEKIMDTAGGDVSI